MTSSVIILGQELDQEFLITNDEEQSSKSSFSKRHIDLFFLYISSEIKKKKKVTLASGCNRIIKYLKSTALQFYRWNLLVSAHLYRSDANIRATSTPSVVPSFLS